MTAAARNDERRELSRETLIRIRTGVLAATVALYLLSRFVGPLRDLFGVFSY